MQPQQTPQRRYRSRKRQRKYVFHHLVSKENGKRLMVILLLTGIMMFCAWQLIRYASDYLNSREAGDQLRQIYYAETEISTAAPEMTVSPSPTSAPTPTAEMDAAATSTPLARLKTVYYPSNHYAIASTRFQKLQKQNGDIVGWLTMDGQLDEAVVQRDNSYYLTRDYRGYHNVNGALFLDESISLSTRPYTLIVYGHNMKTGAMFGNLRHYEKISFYQEHPFITFDTMFEEGRYVIFSMARLSLNIQDSNYISIGGLNSLTVADRQTAIDTLIDQSVFSTDLDVQPEDQLLLLITCIDGEDDRRIVSARRLREGETEADLQAIVNRARLW